MKKIILSLFVLAICCCRGQEIGYLSGVNRIGIDPTRFQPLYGFTVGAKFHKAMAVETALFYSQRSYRDVIQADYFTFMAMLKLGYFGKKAGVYYCPGISLNPTLYHSNIKNHTYLSHIQAVGGQIDITPRMLADIKLGYDIGLTGAYFDNGAYSKYSGPVLMAGLKFRLGKI